MMTEIFGTTLVRDRRNHFCAGANNAAPFGVFADHEAVHVVEEDEGDEVLIAVHDEAGGFLRALGIDDAADFDLRRSRRRAHR